MAVGAWAMPAARQLGARPRYGLIATGLALALVAALLPPVYAVAVLAATALGAALLARPVLALYLLVFSVPYGAVNKLQTGGVNVTITEFLAFCAGAAFLMQSAIRGRVRVRWAWWAAPLLLYIGVAIVSASGASSFTLSLKEVLKLGELLVTYLLVLTYVDTPVKLRRLVTLLVLAVGSQALYGLVQTFGHVGPSSFVRAGALRASGTFDQPNPFAGYIDFTLPLMIAGVITGTPVVRWWTKPAVVIMAAALLASGSRGAYIALIAALAVMLIVYIPRARALLAVAGVALFGLVAGAFFGLVPSSITTVVLDLFGVSNIDVANPTPQNWPTAERLAHQLAGLRMFADHPLLGVGIGNYPTAYAHYQVAPVWIYDLGHAHNYYINIAAEAGIVGLIAFLVVLIAAFVIVARLYRRAATPWARTVALGALGALVTVAVHNNFDNIFVHEMEAQFALIVGIATVACRLETVDSRQPIVDSKQRVLRSAIGNRSLSTID